MGVNSWVVLVEENVDHHFRVTIAEHYGEHPGETPA